MRFRIEVVDPGVMRIALPDKASNVYLFLARRLGLVDAGGRTTTPDLVAALDAVGVAPDQIDLILLTHEHHDHVGGLDAFPNALVAAHPLAAAKLRHDDRDTTGLDAPRAPDLELGHGSAIHLGGFSFRVLHTPGHSSGSICLYERSRRVIVTGDTAYARGTLSLVSASGSRGDHLDSLERLAALPARLLLPGHGHISEDPRVDLEESVTAARSGLVEQIAER